MYELFEYPVGDGNQMHAHKFEHAVRNVGVFKNTDTNQKFSNLSGAYMSLLNSSIGLKLVMKKASITQSECRALAKKSRHVTP